MLLFVAILISAAATVHADDYRLPQALSPVDYDLRLTFSREIFETEAGSGYSGIVNITLDVIQNTNQIKLHATPSRINITSAWLSNEINVNDVSTNSTLAIVTIQLDGELQAGDTVVLELAFDGNISTSDMYGVYKSSYTEASGKAFYFVTTQFESTNARRAFPCFDEPGFKATFSLSLSYPSGQTAISNREQLNNTSADNFTTTVFETSPRMSSYLLAFIVSEFTCTAGIPLEGNLTNQVCSRNETVENREWALEVTPKIIDAINAYTGINYSYAMTKLDQVAITDFSAGAMENWGLVTYRERALLYDEVHTSNSVKQYIASVISHELAHQWFGNLVTCKWWSEIFLNEGFATLLEYFITDEILPDYAMDKQFVIKTVQYIFEEDASTSESLRDSASTPAQISARFGSITYDKGGSVLRMAENILGSAQWRSSLKAYLNKFQYDSAEPDDLWEAIGNSTTVTLPWNVSTIMHNWINSPGYPVLSVSLNGSQVSISQKRFVFNESISSNTKWYVPITYTTSADTSTFYNTTPSYWLSTSSDLVLDVLSSNSWIIVNNLQTGYYRVNYDSVLWSRLTSALLAANFSGIPDVNRAQIVNDAFNLARAGSISYNDLFSITQFLVSETSYVVWYPAFSGFDYLIKRVGKNSTLGEKISSHITELSEAVVSAVPLSVTNASNHIYTLGQVQAQSWACKLGNTNCINTAVDLFASYRNSNVSPDKNLRSIVYCYGLKSSTNITRDWDFLWNAFLSTSLSTEQVTILAALGCSSDESILIGYLNKTVNSDSGIRSQDYAAVFAAVYQNSDIGVDVALDFYINNFELILEKYTSWNSAGTLLKRIAELITSESQLTKLTNFIASGAPNGVILEAARVAQSSASNNLAWVNTFRDDLELYYGVPSDTSSTESSTTSASTTSSTSTPSTTTSKTTATTPSGSLAPEIIVPGLVTMFTIMLIQFVV